jgi:RHS repeat-associated protein
MQALALTTDRDYYTRAANEDCINGGPRTRTKYLYDAAGNTNSYSNLTFTYNNAGRESGVTVGRASSSYVYNALGQMIQKSVGSTVTLLMYDEAGHLLGEYSSTGALIQETVWMGDIPVATLRPNGSTISIYYVHTDQLNAPRKITRPSDNGLMWRWDADPFGTAAPNQNPASLGTFIYNLRFPGQYYQAETGLNYNYFRDYDPATGRYIESDPIGLRAGVNTYAYANNNPLSRTDPFGLFSVDYPVSTGSARELPGDRIGETRDTTGVTCACKQCGNSWSLDSCHANVYLKVRILAPLSPAADAFSRKSEQEHVDDFKSGRREVETAGWKAEQAQQRLTYPNERSCLEAAVAKVLSAVNAVVLAQEADSKGRDDRGEHTYHGPR